MCPQIHARQIRAGPTGLVLGLLLNESVSELAGGIRERSSSSAVASSNDRQSNGTRISLQSSHTDRVQITAKTEALQPLRREQRTPEFRAKYRERVKVEHRIGRCIQLGARQARYLGKAKLAFQIAMVATVANLTLAISQSGFESLWFTLSALIVLVTDGRPFPALANVESKIAAHWAEVLAEAPVGPEIAICRPLF